MDLDSAFMLTLMNYLFKKFDITIKTVATYSHQSLQVEHGIKSFSNILTKHLTDHGHMWHMYLSVAFLAYNTFISPILGNYSPYKLVFGRKLKLLLDLETNPNIKILGTYKDYYTLLNKRLHIKDSIRESYYNVCWTLGSVQNCRPAQLFVNDFRWEIVARTL